MCVNDRVHGRGPAGAGGGEGEGDLRGGVEGDDGTDEQLGRAEMGKLINCVLRS